MSANHIQLPADSSISLAATSPLMSAVFEDPPF
jgi:hypothetical protein